MVWDKDSCNYQENVEHKYSQGMFFSNSGSCGSCPVVYTLFETTCYKMVPILANRTDTEADCASNGDDVHLASVQIPQENIFIANLTEQSLKDEGRGHRIGGNYVPDLKWTDGQPVSFQLVPKLTMKVRISAET